MRKKSRGKNDGRLLSLDLVRSLAIVLVILFHLLYEIYRSHSLRPIGYVGLSLFFILSGYILVVKYPKLKSFSPKWLAVRLVRLCSVYYLALISILILFGSQTHSGSVLDVFLTFVFLNPLVASAEYIIISPTWFLTPLVGLYILYPYLNRYVSKSDVFLAFIFVFTVAFRIYVGEWTSYSPLFFLADFCFGIALARGKKLLPLLFSLLLFVIDPMMVLPFFLFYFIYKINDKYIPGKIVQVIGVNTIILFFFHEAFIKILFGKWSVFGLSKVPAVLLLLLFSVVTFYLSVRIQRCLLRRG